MSRALVFRKKGEALSWALLRRSDDFGVEELDLLRPPGRFWSDGALSPSGAEMHVDSRRVDALALPSELLAVPPKDGWHALSKRSLGRVAAWFLLTEDPQRRLEAQPIATLAHQASVVHHIGSRPELRRVLLADEVGLGKTIEAGLLIKHFLEQRSGARILYLSPARLVRNVWSELKRMGLPFRRWIASAERDATLDDKLVVASIHRASHEGRIAEVVAAPPWDMIIVDECHHLSDWGEGGGKPVAQYRLVQQLVERLADDGRLVLMSGTPHQGHGDRFANVLRLLRRADEPDSVLAGRVIYRTKEDVQDWEGRPLFPRRQVNKPQVIDLGAEYKEWLSHVHDLFEPDRVKSGVGSAQRRVAGWRAGQALQWATSSVQAGLGYLIRQAVRGRFKPSTLPGLAGALEAIRPYRGGKADEAVETLYARIEREVLRQMEADDVEDIEEEDEQTSWRPDPEALSALLEEGVDILESLGDAKWDFVWDRMLKPAGDEKVVLFAQPIETVTVVADFLERKTGRRPAMIVGGQTDAERTQQVERFWDPNGPQFLVSSRAGGEGLNLQIARRLVHLDVPWNPMELEQRIGRVHRFMSRRTILVDTVVVKDSREVDSYAYARERLRMIASTMGSEDKFEALFSRVMALVPPEELQDVLGQNPIGPLSDADRTALADLVSRGYQEWKSFHDRYSSQQQTIRALDPGAATWEDLATLALEHLGAKPAEGFSALAFLWQDDEIVEATKAARVLVIDGKPYSCGDYGGMPVTGPDGRAASRLGTNIDVVAAGLRRLAFPDGTVGAAHVRWPEDAKRPATGPFGLLVAARQCVRWAGGSYVEQGMGLHVRLVPPHGPPRDIEGAEKGEVLRALLRAVVRREPAVEGGLTEALRASEQEWVGQLRRPPDAEVETRNVITPLLVAVVA